ncbi:MAG: class II aldolase/adducin family protein [Propionibacteriaceae bacterium]|nr:class II aldolase/adducin family protein [Propionibacteriaceae bacterium]
MNLTRDLIELSHTFGADETYVRAGGGNISLKHDGVLRIKPSGVALASLRGDELVGLRVSTLLHALDHDLPGDGDPVQRAASAARVGADDRRRPSVEILFHALIPDPLVLHLHPLVANALTCNESDRELAARLLGDEAIVVGYVDPGVALARAIRDARDAYSERTSQPPPAVTLLANHGIIVSGRDAAAVAERTRWLTGRIAGCLSCRPAIADASREEILLAARWGKALGGVARVASAVADREAARALSERGPLIPDQIVYAGSFPVILGEAMEEILESYRGRWGRDPVTGLLPGGAVAGFGRSEAAALNAAHTLADAIWVASAANRLGRVRTLTEDQWRFIEGWEAESYRKRVASAG